MISHIVTLSDEEIENLISGTSRLFLIFFKKRPDFLEKIHLGDLVYFKKRRGEILGQFEIGKLITVEKIEEGDWSWIKEDGKIALTKADFLKKLEQNSFLIIIQITKLEQFITPPIEINKRSKKEWLVLG